MFKKIALVLLMVCLLFIPATVSGGKDYVAEHYDVDILLGNDGSMHVTETITFRFMGGPFTFIYRTLDKTRVDEINFTNAMLDGNPLTVNGENALEWVEVAQGNPVQITWHFAPTTDQTRVCSLSYDVVGVVRKNGTDAVIWMAIPPEHDYLVQESRITVSYPPEAVPAGQPQLAGTQNYQTVVNGNPIILTSGAVDPDTAIVLSLNFDSGTLSSFIPDWQRSELEQSERMANITPFLIAGILIGLTVLSAVLIVTASRRDPVDETSIPDSPSKPVSPPTNYRPAVAVALAARANPTLMHSLATMIDLAQRGILSIEQVPGKWPSPNRFEIVKISQPDNLSMHEQILMETLFIKRGVPVTRVALEQYPQVIGRHIGDFSRAVKTEIALLGLISPERKKRQTRLLIAGTCLLLAGLLIGVALAMIVFNQNTQVPIGLDRFIGGVLGACIAAFFGGLAFIIFAALYSPLTSQGRWIAGQWNGFSLYLRDIIAWREELLRPDTFNQFLPYATGFGLGEQWAKSFRKRGSIKVPDWFHALKAQNAEAAFGAFGIFMASSSSGASSASGVGGGASGGGGSGAG
jgi:uncharacterized membrane protein YgcG